MRNTFPFPKCTNEILSQAALYVADKLGVQSIILQIKGTPSSLGGIIATVRNSGISVLWLKTRETEKPRKTVPRVSAKFCCGTRYTQTLNAMFLLFPCFFPCFAKPLSIQQHEPVLLTQEIRFEVSQAYVRNNIAYGGLVLKPLEYSWARRFGKLLQHGSYWLVLAADVGIPVAASLAIEKIDEVQSIVHSRNHVTP